MKRSTFNMAAIQTQIYSQSFGFPTGTPPEYLAVNPSPSATQNPPPPPQPFSQPFAPAAEFENQISDFDRLICLQNERLRLGLQRKGKQEMGLVMRHWEPKIRFLLKRKEAEIREALNKNAELEALLRGAGAEREGWKSAAMEREAAAGALEAEIRRVQQGAGEKGAAAAESWCDGGGERMTAAVCRSCNREECSVVFMPCRHLGSCKSCEGLLEWCPLCWTVKRTAIDALLS
ncbi:unnamed protein product [Cuscuta campestris]|uniref:RING-type domain-containing protein n=1 Tax=Cuscuta campestris TaxID=132261 RepID=A0A484MWN6_9ASTE|nr:unnamed protein product [Cuscuta campestris]